MDAIRAKVFSLSWHPSMLVMLVFKDDAFDCEGEWDSSALLHFL